MPTIGNVGHTGNASGPRLTFYTDFADQSPTEDDQLVIPADLTELSDEALAELHTQAAEAFTALYNDGHPAQNDMEALGELTAGLENILSENGRREELSAQRAEEAAAMAARVGMSVQRDEGEDSDAEDAEDVEDAEDEDDSDDSDEVTGDEGAGETEGFARERRIKRPKRKLPPAPDKGPLGIRDVMHASGKGTTFQEGEGIDWMDAGRITDQRYSRFKRDQYANAARSKRHMSEKFAIANITKPIDDDLRIVNNDHAHVFEVVSRAIDESRLPSGSLVAAGGWCAPSEVVYDLLELESRDGIFSLPEVGMARGGVIRTLGPSFADLYTASRGFSYTEAQDIAGTYGVDDNGVGNDTEGGKPCITLDCPEFEEFRLGVTGICVNAGILQQRGYPELIARSLRGVLVAHDHHMAGRVLSDIVAGSTAVTMPAGQVGATTPVLNAIEMQVEHYRYMHRIARSTTFEAVFPYWVRGLIRTDLGRRENIDVLNVTDAQINAWFSLRGIAPQFVYNWQDITGEATAFTAWPTEVQFLLYPAGTWVRGTSDIITLESQFDSVLLANNDYNALFTEEGYVVFNMNHDSRVVTVGVDATGAYAAGVDIAHDGTAATAGA